MEGTDIPKGWQTIEDDASGNIYYYHTATGSCTYEHPATLVSGEWTKLIDLSSNAYYYYNETTLVSQWEEPEGCQFDETERKVDQDLQALTTRHSMIRGNSNSSLTRTRPDSLPVQEEEKDEEFVDEEYEALLKRGEELSQNTDKLVGETKTLIGEDVVKDQEEQGEVEYTGVDDDDDNNNEEEENDENDEEDDDEDEEEDEHDEFDPMQQPITPSVSVAQIENRVERLQTQADILSEEYFRDIQKINVDDDELLKRGPTLDGSKMSLLEKMQEQMEKRVQEAEEAAKEAEIQKKLAMEEEERKKQKMREQMKLRWVELRKIKEEEDKKIQDMIQDRRRRVYFQAFWTAPNSELLTDYSWAYNQSSAALVGESKDNEYEVYAEEEDDEPEESRVSPEQGLSNDSPIIESTRLPVHFKLSPRDQKLELRSGLVTRNIQLGVRPKTVGTFDLQIVQNLQVGHDHPHHKGGRYKLPPVNVHKRCVTAGPCFGARPGSAHSIKQAGTKIKARPMTVAGQIRRRKMDPTSNNQLKELKKELNRELEPTGESFEEIKKQVLLRLAKTHEIDVPDKLKFDTKPKELVPARPKVEEDETETKAQENSKVKKKKMMKKKKKKKKTKKSVIVKTSLTKNSTLGSEKGEQPSKTLSPSRLKLDDENSAFGPGLLEEQSIASAKEAVAKNNTNDADALEKISESVEKVPDEHLIKLFKAMDTSGDGFVDIKEMKTAIKQKQFIRDILHSSPALELLLQEDICELLFTTIDVDESGDVSREEFLRVFGRTLNETDEDRQRRQDFRKLFDAMDKNGDGSISMYELRTALRNDKIIMDMIKQSSVLRPLLRASAYQRISAIYLQFDEDESGTLEWPEFEKVCHMTFPKTK